MKVLTILEEEGYNMKAWNKLADRIEAGIDLDINKLATTNVL